MVLNYINVLSWGMGFDKVLVIAKKTVFTGNFSRTFVIESTNFQVR